LVGAAALLAKLALLVLGQLVRVSSVDPPVPDHRHEVVLPVI
jgi:hypothetical protein